MSEKAMPELRLFLKLAWSAFSAGSIRAFYDQISPFYEAVFVHHKLHVDDIVTLLAGIYPEKANCIVLDLGCGTGLLSKALSKQGFRVVGIDISLQSLQLLQQSDRGVAVVQGDAASLPFLGESFQALVCLGVWRHFPNQEVVLNEICRVIGRDGIFVLGYFPPRLGGIFHVRNNTVGRMLLWLYNRTVHWCGYDDIAHFNLEKQAREAIGKRFEQVRRIKSGEHWHLILACRTKER